MFIVLRRLDARVIMDFTFYFKKSTRNMNTQETKRNKKYKASKMWHDLGIAEQQKAKKGRDDCIELQYRTHTHCMYRQLLP